MGSILGDQGAKKEHFEFLLVFSKDHVLSFSCQSHSGSCTAHYPLVNIQKTMENPHAINGKTHYFNGHVQVRKL